MGALIGSIGLTIAILVLCASVAYLEFRMAETRNEIRQLRHQVEKLEAAARYIR